VAQTKTKNKTNVIALSIVATAQRDLNSCAAAQGCSLEGTLFANLEKQCGNGNGLLFPSAFVNVFQAMQFRSFSLRV